MPRRGVPPRTHDEAGCLRHLVNSLFVLIGLEHLRPDRAARVGRKGQSTAAWPSSPGCRLRRHRPTNRPAPGAAMPVAGAPRLEPLEHRSGGVAGRCGGHGGSGRHDRAEVGIRRRFPPELDVVVVGGRDASSEHDALRRGVAAGDAVAERLVDPCRARLLHTPAAGRRPPLEAPKPRSATLLRRGRWTVRQCRSRPGRSWSRC